MSVDRVYGISVQRQYCIAITKNGKVLLYGNGKSSKMYSSVKRQGVASRYNMLQSMLKRW